MKRILALSIVLLLILCGCGGGNDTGNASVTSTSTKPTVPPNPYSLEDFSHNGKFMYCLTGESHAGIDVSSHQGLIDWQQVKDYGVEFVFVRLGYRGYEYGNICQDEYALYNLTQAKAVGLQVGAYFFSQAVTEAEALEEAEFALGVLGSFQLDLPLVFDWEQMEADARTDQITKKELMPMIHAFCGKVKEAGYAPMVYFNPTLAETHLDMLDLMQYPFWLAAYSADKGTGFPYRVEFWQYSDNGTIPGIEKPVDLNIWLPAV